MKTGTAQFPTPHLGKLKTLFSNERLPDCDKDRIQEALQRYHQWIAAILSVQGGRTDTVQRLVDATNQYKRFIELELIFNSPADFLYRQKGQLKLDNTILEEFLPHLFYRGLSLPDSSFELGPRTVFSGLSFVSSLASLGTGGQPHLRTKDHDFTIGKSLHIKTSFDSDFRDAEYVKTSLGYVCVECKTNLDKTMFQEAVATSRDLKIAIPSSLYFLVCEFLDMTPASIASTHIDDVLIVRKARRMPANVRQEYKTANKRKSHRDQYVQFLEGSQYYADVFQRMIDKIQRTIATAVPATDAVLRQGHF